MPEEEGPPVGRNGAWRPVPDPTVLTTELIDRAIEATQKEFEGKLEVLRERLSGIDEATKLLRSDSSDIPKQIDEKVHHLRELTDEKFLSIDKQFAERDTRQERESRDNKTAVDAAFSAQKESAATQDQNNQKNIDKSEKSMLEQIKAVGDKVDDLKDRVGRIESIKTGVQEARAGISGGIGTAIAIALLVIAVIGFFLGQATT